MAYTFTDVQKSKLERIATAMMLGADILDAAGVPVEHVAVANLMEGHAEVMRLLYPNGVPAEAIDECCPCGQPIGHGIIQ
jgi:hypothetical protein